MTSETMRDPVKDHLLTPWNSAFIVIDYQPVQVSSIRSMNQKELVFNIVHTAKAAVNYNLPSVTAHEAALRRVEQAGAILISKTQLYCELQRDWAREKTVPGFMDVFESWDGFNPEKHQ